MGRQQPVFSTTKSDTLFRVSIRVVDDRVCFEKRCISSNHREFGQGAYDEAEFDVAVDAFLASPELRATVGTALGPDVLEALCTALGAPSPSPVQPPSPPPRFEWPSSTAEGRAWVRFMVLTALLLLLGLAIGLSDHGFSLPG
jgi:hypothetical protein